MSNSVLAFIAIGSNLSSPKDNVMNAILEVKNISGVAILASSSLYLSPPFGHNIAQPDFINAVIKIETILSPHELLQRLLDLELAYGRVRKEKWGPRTLDLDLLLYGELEYSDQDLTIPHPGLCYRNFVIQPLHEIAPDLILPDGTKIQKLAQNLIDVLAIV